MLNSSNVVASLSYQPRHFKNMVPHQICVILYVLWFMFTTDTIRLAVTFILVKNNFLHYGADKLNNA